MKVFLSWSGERSQKTAELLNDWLKCVIQACRPWVSTRDLDRGSLWFGEINDQLKDTSVGVICLTQENKLRPWILFEAGALAKGLSTSRVCTLLVDLEPKDVEDPLAQFNHSFPKRESMFSLVRTLNATLPAGGLDERILETVFDTYWPQFEDKFEQLIKSTIAHPKAKPRDKDDVLGEILEVTRSLSGRLRAVEHSVDERDKNRIVRTGSSLRSRIRQDLESGIPSDIVVREYLGRLPSHILRTEVERFEAHKLGLLDDGSPKQ